MCRIRDAPVLTVRAAGMLDRPWRPHAPLRILPSSVSPARRLALSPITAVTEQPSGRASFGVLQAPRYLAHPFDFALVDSSIIMEAENSNQTMVGNAESASNLELPVFDEESKIHWRLILQNPRFLLDARLLDSISGAAQKGPEDASLLSESELLEVSQKDPQRFEKLSFVNCSIKVIDRVFPKQRAKNGYGQNDPPDDYKTWAKTLCEWRALSGRQQKAHLSGTTALSDHTQVTRKRIRVESDERMTAPAIGPSCLGISLDWILDLWHMDRKEPIAKGFCRLIGDADHCKFKAHSQGHMWPLDREFHGALVDHKSRDIFALLR